MISSAILYLEKEISTFEKYISLTSKGCDSKIFVELHS